MDIKGVRQIRIVTSPPPPYGGDGIVQHLELHFAEGQVVRVPLEHEFVCAVMRAETTVDRDKE